MIGVSMGLTIAVCIGGFSVIYASLDNVVGDFVSRDVPTAIVQTPATEGQVAANDPETGGGDGDAEQLAPEPTAPPTTPPESTPPPAEEPEEFTPDRQSSSQQTIRFRTEPGTSGGEETIVTVLTPSTPVQSTGETETNDDPEPNTLWIQLRLEDGTVGWMREIDTEPFEE